jgi:hypothetical protein
MSHSIREARLRRAYAPMYPDLTPGVWVPACVLAEFILERGLYQRRTGSAPRDRLLVEEHFEFRGGSEDLQAWPRVSERRGEGAP